MSSEEKVGDLIQKILICEAGRKANIYNYIIHLFISFSVE